MKLSVWQVQINLLLKRSGSRVLMKVSWRFDNDKNLESNILIYQSLQKGGNKKKNQ